MTILRVKDLTTVFKTGSGDITAVEDISFEVAPGEILGIVGESGSGKSVTALTIMGLLPQPPARIARGSILFDGLELVGLSESRMRHIRGPGIAMVFQEPLTSLNPVFSVGEQITETLRAHERISPRIAQDRAIALLDRVGIAQAGRRLGDYPHQLSGGMRQRVMIAIALACNPKLLIADEPTTALDVTIQAQILDLLLDLRQERGMAIIAVTHNMGVVAEIADRVMVMYAGRIAEQAPVERIFSAPAHPYTTGLLSCVPSLNDDLHRLAAIGGTLPDPAQRPPGCRYAPRCPKSIDACGAALPPLVPVETAHEAACIRVGAP